MRALLRQVGRMAGFFFGQMQWSPPPWLIWLGGKGRAAGAGTRRHPLATIVIIGGLAAAGIGGWMGWQWWLSHRPRALAYQVEQAVAVKLLPPGEIALGVEDKDVHPLPLVVEFSLPAAKMERIGKPAGKEVRLDPATDGTWSWRDSRHLVFLPKANYWPAGTEFKVLLDPAHLQPELKFDILRPVFTTPALRAEIREFQFHTEPQDPGKHEVAGEIRFNYPVAAADLAAHLKAKVLGGTPLFGAMADANDLFSVQENPKSARGYFVHSRRITIPLREDFITLAVTYGLKPATGGSAMAAGPEAKTRVPDKFSGLFLTEASTTIIRTDDGDPQQFLFIDTTLDMDSREISKRIKVCWRERGFSPDDRAKLDQEVASAHPVAMEMIESEAPLAKRHAFRFKEPRPGSMLVRVDAGVLAPGGFELKNRFQSVVSVPAYPKDLKILGKGNILALGGARKILVQSRGVDHLRLTIGRVPISQIQHLVAMNRWGKFSDPQFNYPFDETNMVQRWSKVVPVPRQNDWQANATEFDLSEAPPMTTPDVLPGGQGIFFVRIDPVTPIKPDSPDTSIYGKIEAPGPDIQNDDEDERYGNDRHGWRYNDGGDEIVTEGWEQAEGTPDRRFVMVTDLGLMLKAAADGSREAFVMSLAAGTPVAGVGMQAIARNGSVLASATTDTEGRALLPALDGYTGERMPVAVLARKDADISFLPLLETQVPAMDYSRYDIGGALASRQQAVEGFLFTERGVYRPGDPVHVGLMVIRRDWQPVLEGLPVKITLTDARGRTVGQQSMRLPYDGFTSCDFPLAETAALGVHRAEAWVLDGKGDMLFRLGRTAVRVEEFQPDRMKVATKIVPAPPAGWMSPNDVTAEVSVRSLFDEPAAERKVTTRLEYSTADFVFPRWAGYVFHDRAAAKSGSVAGRSTDLGETKTDARGIASVPLPIHTMEGSSFRLAVLTEAFEREGGRSVRAATTCLVSPWEEVLGWKADGDLDNLGKDATRQVHMIAIDRTLNPVDRKNLRQRLIEIRRVAVLSKLPNGNHAYVSTLRENVVSEADFILPATGVNINLATAKASAFRLEICSPDNMVLARIPYRVVGKGEEDRVMEREAELDLTLSTPSAKPGEEIEIHLTAPYAGSGVITMERERVVAARWFRSDGKSAVVKMRVPDDAEGTLYVNASFVRAPDSPEIFHSPLSYAAAPLNVVPLRRQLEIKLDAPQVVRPGSDAKFGFTASAPSRVVIYAVDEGIHQITRYELPKPLGFFARKQALEVRTLQWLDLLMPEYQFLKSSPAFGGDGDSALSLHLNPFKRRREPPVVFWSGVIEAGTDRREVTWHVPDYFNGNVRIMAVGAKAGAVGAAESAMLVKAPIILQPNVPIFVAPGDEFEANVAVTNNLDAPGSSGITITAKPSAHLSQVGPDAVTVQLEKGKEAVARYRFKANDLPGGATLAFTAVGAGETIGRETTMSVRPAGPHRTRVLTGWFRTGTHEEKPQRSMYAEFRKLEATASVLPLGMARGLEAYVSEYPHGCSEQITSRAMVKLVSSTEADFGLPPAEAAAQIRSAIAQLANRQQANGGFGYWYSGAPREFEFHSLYVFHFLLEAKLLGHAVPEGMLKDAAAYAAATARANITSPWQAELQAYAIYLCARQGTNPTPQLLNLRDALGKKFAGQWQGEATAAWMAATYRLLQQDKEAAKLMDLCLKTRKQAATTPMPHASSRFYHNSLDVDALKIFYVRCRHFPEQARVFGIDDLDPVMKPLREENFSTLSAAFITLSLKAYSDVTQASGFQASIFAVPATGGEARLLAGPGPGILRAAFDPGTGAIRFKREQSGKGDVGVFYQILEQGFDKGKPPGPLTSGLAVFREWIPVGGKDKVLHPGDAVDVRLRVRNLAAIPIHDMAVIDLLPGGFEVLAGELPSGAGTVPGTTFSESREDRSLFYLALAGNQEWSARYRMKAVCAGSFVVPTAMAEDMYDRGRHGVSAPGAIKVEPSE